MKTVLVTGGAGYIGSHVAISLLESGYDIVIIDDLSNSSENTISNISKFKNMKINFCRGNIFDQKLLDQIFFKFKPDAVIHLAAHKCVSESLRSPANYYWNNFVGTMRVIEAMSKHRVYNLVYSSTANVYGPHEKSPISEDKACPSPDNPYGKSKLMTENFLNDLYDSEKKWSIIKLRYFNPVGAHESGIIGETVSGTPSNIMPLIAMVASKKIQQINVYGCDYDTKDGTGMRDYIHVMDLADGHVKALTELLNRRVNWTINLGTGKGVTVLELIKEFEKACNVTIPYKFCSKRPGDIAISYTDPSYGMNILNWKPSRNIQQMCEDTWRWERATK